MKKKNLTRKKKKTYTKLGTYPGCKKSAETMGKHYKPNAKRKNKLSAAQQKSLKAGRKVLSYLRTGRKIAEPKEPILIREGVISMNGKKRGRKKTSTKKHSRGKMLGFEGFEGKRKRRSPRRRSSYLHGAAEGFNPGNLAMDAAGLIGGAVAASFLASIIPFAKTPKMKALIPLLCGIGVLSFPKISKHRIANRAGLGAIAIGAYTLTKQFLPALPLMGGADDAEGVLAAIDALPDEQKAILGLLPQQETAGEITDQTAGEVDTYGELAADADTYGELAADADTYGEDGEDGEDFTGEPAPLSPASMRI